MANANPSFTGQINQAGTLDALQLKVFGGEIITAFNRACVFMDKHTVRKITAGKSAQFPAIGKTTAAYHTPGVEITGDKISHNEQIIVIDDVLLASVALAQIDEAKNHYDVRSEYTNQLGDALAQAFDQNVARVGVLAARASNPITGLPGGTVVSDASMATDSDKLVAALYTTAQKLDEKDVPSGDRNAFLRPAQYYLSVQNQKLLNRDYAGSANITSGTVDSAAGLKIVKSNNVPGTNVTTGPTKYQGDFSATVGLVMNRGAVGTVKLLELAVESGWDMRRQVTLMIAKYAVGHGILRPNCAAELTTAVSEG
jgi:hypothetical protein